MMYFLIVISIFYALLILYLRYGFHQVKEFVSEEKPAKTSFSIIIAFRNEAANLPQLFLTLKKLKYPVHLFEIILVNDDSTDNSEAISNEFKNSNPQLHISVLKNQQPKSAKKAAINTGINSAEKEYIITTDADCEVPENWLTEFDCFIQKTEVKFISGPVVFEKGKGLLNIFQRIDF
ncbi:MAG TPA: glycosyltransferase, partial [Salinimicrobium sp.]|nr:glycosyltransferase [Salinimicrobium sp.]